jgi:hypothetical protein
MLVLASLSVGNALWSETLVINGNATTGQMSVEWRTGGTTITKSEDDPLNVAQVDCFRDSNDFKKVHVVLTNAYPGYEAACSFRWANTGTIPVRVQSLYINSTQVPFGSEEPISFDVGGDSQPDLDIALTGQVNSIFNQPPPQTGGSNQITIKVLAGAPETTTLSFTAHVNIIQAPHPAP